MKSPPQRTLVRLLALLVPEHEHGPVCAPYNSAKHCTVILLQQTKVIEA